jgi:hypothetical protein
LSLSLMVSFWVVAQGLQRIAPVRDLVSGMLGLRGPQFDIDPPAL